jgi:hypothetical protein
MEELALHYSQLGWSHGFVREFEPALAAAKENLAWTLRAAEAGVDVGEWSIGAAHAQLAQAYEWVGRDEEAMAQRSEALLHIALQPPGRLTDRMGDVIMQHMAEAIEKGADPG